MTQSTGYLVSCDMNWLEYQTIEGASPVSQHAIACFLRLSTAGLAKSGGKLGRPRPKAPYST